jgi:hypothetical protein
MDVNEMKKNLDKQSLDPLLVVLSNKGYQWMISHNSKEEDAVAFEEYILNNTTLLELEEIKNKKKYIKDFIMWKYINHLDR